MRTSGRLKGTICFPLLRSVLKQSCVGQPLRMGKTKRCLPALQLRSFKRKAAMENNNPSTVRHHQAPTICTNKHKNKQIVHYLLLKSIMCNFFIFLIMVLCDAWIGSLATSPFLATTTNRQKTESALKSTWVEKLKGLGRGAGYNDNLVGMILSLQFHFLQLHRFALSAWMKVNLQETSHLFYVQLTFP